MAGWNLGGGGTTWGFPNPFAGQRTSGSAPINGGTTASYEWVDPHGGQPNEPGYGYDGQANQDWANTERQNLADNMPSGRYGSPAPSPSNRSVYDRPIPGLDPTLQMFAQHDENSLFKQWFDGLNGYNDVGLESQRRQAHEAAALRRRLANSSSTLSGNLAGLDESLLFNMLNMDNKAYDVNVGDINAMKKSLLEGLGFRNDARNTQRAYYGSKKSEARTALESALAGSDEDREAGEHVRSANDDQLLDAFSGRGMALSRGFEQARWRNNQQHDDLLKSIARRDTNTRNDYQSTLTDIRNALDKIKHAQTQDTHDWRENNRGFDTDLTRLSQDKERGGFKFMHGVAAARERKAAAEREKNLASMQMALAKRQADAAMAQAQAENRRNSFITAANQQMVWDQNKHTFYNALTENQIRDNAAAAWEAGNIQLFNEMKFMAGVRGMQTPGGFSWGGSTPSSGSSGGGYRGVWGGL